MLSRAPTTLGLTAQDITHYEERKVKRDAKKNQDTDSSQNSDRSTVENGAGQEEQDLTPAAATRAARSKMSREQRIGVGSSRG